MAYNLLFLFGKLVQKVFFGHLRDAEIQVWSALSYLFLSFLSFVHSTLLWRLSSFLLFVILLLFYCLFIFVQQNLSDRLLTYVLFKIVFVGAVMEPDLKNLLIWTSWFSILGFLKIFTLLTRDRFEYVCKIPSTRFPLLSLLIYIKLNTFSPHTHPTIHVRMLTLLVLILFSDLAWFAIS